MVICLERGADLHTAQLMSLPLTASCFSKIQMVLPSWYRLIWVVLDKGPLNRCIGVFQVISLIYSLTYLRRETMRIRSTRILQARGQIYKMSYYLS